MEGILSPILSPRKTRALTRTLSFFRHVLRDDRARPKTSCSRPEMVNGDLTSARLNRQGGARTLIIPIDNHRTGLPPTLCHQVTITFAPSKHLRMILLYQQLHPMRIYKDIMAIGAGRLHEVMRGPRPSYAGKQTEDGIWSRRRYGRVRITDRTKHRCEFWV